MPVHLFIAALSGRALAQAAHQLGLACTVADCFNDADTWRYAQTVANVASEHDVLRIDVNKLINAFESCAEKHERVVIITGSGFESNLPALRSLSKSAGIFHAQCACNDADVLSRITDPVQLFAALDELDAAHPLTRTTPPVSTAGWWVKQRGGHGATHVRPYINTPENALDGIYYQEDIVGSEHSMLAIGDISSTVCIQFNRQLIKRRAEPEAPFQYQGAIAATAQALGISSAQEQKLKQLAQALCERFMLRGLFGIDFMLHEGLAYILEVNARPTASFELLEAAQALAMHLHAFGVQVPVPAAAHRYRVAAGHLYVFAPFELTVDAVLERSLLQQGLVPCISDWPMLNTVVQAGAPLCNLHAQGDTPDEVNALLQAREQMLLSLLTSSKLAPAKQGVA